MIAIAESDPPTARLSLADSLLRGVPHAYAVLFFSPEVRLGWWLMAVSLLSPGLGLSGLASASAAGVLAWWLGYDRAHIRNGFLLFNPLLAGFAAAYLQRSLHFPPLGFAVLWCAVVVGSFTLSVAVQHWVNVHSGLSAHSLPAMLTMYVLYFTGFALFGGPHGAHVPDGWLDLPFLATPARGMFQAFGGMLFQPHALTGILVFIGLALASPLSGLIASLSFLASLATIWALGFPLEPDLVTWCGLNCLLCGIALGTGYFITSGASLVLALVGAVLCALVSLAFTAGLRPFGLPVSVLPYNLVVPVIVYALRRRWSPGALHPSPAPGALPESAAREELVQTRRFPHLRTPALFLPCDGPRTITQGFDGALTHRSHWQYALDFEAERLGDKHAGAGAALTDFYTFGTPVYSPCAGFVVDVVNHVADNEPGQNNPSENWGNYALLHTDEGPFVLLAHLQQNSSAVFIGQRVWPGTLLGLCGNSGRSPVPHLHLQIQDTALLGAATRPFCLKHFIETALDGRSPVYHTSGLPPAGAHVQPTTPHPGLSEVLYGWLPGEYRYRIEGDGAVREETLLLDFDDAGCYRLRSLRTPARLTAFLAEGVFYITCHEGDNHSMLAYLATGLARVPCIADPCVTWRDRVSAAPFHSRPQRWLRDLWEPFFGPFLLPYTYDFQHAATAFVVRAIADTSAPDAATPPPRAPREITCSLAGRSGLVRIEVQLHNQSTLKAELVNYQPAS